MILRLCKAVNYLNHTVNESFMSHIMDRRFQPLHNQKLRYEEELIFIYTKNTVLKRQYIIRIQYKTTNALRILIFNYKPFVKIRTSDPLTLIQHLFSGKKLSHF